MRRLQYDEQREALESELDKSRAFRRQVESKCQQPPPDMTEKEMKEKKKNLLKILNEYKSRMFPRSKGLSELQPFENYTAEDIKMMRKVNAKIDKYLEMRAKEWEKYEAQRKKERRGLQENHQNIINWEALSYEGRQRKLKEL